MAEQTIAQTEAVEAPRANDAQHPADATREDRRYLAPPVDIYETQAGLVVAADMPGVAADGIEVKLDNDLLTIHGRVAPREQQDPVLHREFGLTGYWRQFRLHEQVDRGQIAAELKHGVLRVTLPHREETRPRRIQVKVA